MMEHRRGKKPITACSVLNHYPRIIEELHIAVSCIFKIEYFKVVFLNIYGCMCCACFCKSGDIYRIRGLFDGDFNLVVW